MMDKKIQKQAVGEKLANIRKILIVRLRSIGDMILIGPAVLALKKTYPGAEITVVSEPLCVPVVAGNPLYDRVIVFSIQRVKTLPFRQMITEYVKFTAFLRNKQFDLTIDLHGGPRAAVITLLSGSRCRLGYELRGRQWAYTISRRVELGNLMIRTHIELLRSVGTSPLHPPEQGLFFPIPVSHRTWAGDFLRSLPRNDLLLVFHCGARFDYKCWPDTHFITLGKKLHLWRKTTIVLIGGKADEDKSREIARAIGVNAVNLAGELPLEKTAALIEQADLMVCNDSGPMHIAEALHIPIISLFGPTDPNIWAPVGKRNRVIQCDDVNPASTGRDGGIAEIPVETVYQVCLAMISEKDGEVTNG